MIIFFKIEHFSKIAWMSLKNLRHILKFAWIFKNTSIVLKLYEHFSLHERLYEAHNDFAIIFYVIDFCHILVHK